MNNSLRAYQASRNDLLARIVQTLSNQQRFVAAWLTGSYASNDVDAVSDLDLNLVVSDLFSENLCRSVEQVSSQTTKERLDLFSQFGTPVIIHENNRNAPKGGTFTFTLYAKSRLMIDWILIPQSEAYRPSRAYILFEKSSIPIAATAKAESLDQRVKKASEQVAFFWMMMAVTAKYFIRRDNVFVICWLEELNRSLREVERLIAGQPREYMHGSLSVFESTREGQKQTIYRLGETMEGVMPALVSIGGQVLPSPLPEIKALLDLENDS